MPTAPRGGGGGVAPRATGGGVSGYLLLVTRDKPPFAEVSGDRPPRHADACHPSAEGNLLRSRRGLSSPPLEGWRLAAGVVRECRLGHLVPFVIASGAWRSSK